MKKTIQQIVILFAVCTLQYAFCDGQNLVPNPSFEKYTVCPFHYFMLPNEWFTCSGDPDYFNACDTTNGFSVPVNGFGFQNAYIGDGFCGFVAISFCSFPYYKEYLGCHLLFPLNTGHKYFISFAVSRAEWLNLASNNIGLLFSTKSYQDYQPYDNTWNVPTTNYAHIVETNIITDMQNWTIIKGNIVADSAYEYIIIGDFFDSIQTDTLIFGHNPLLQCSYYYLDNVCVSEDSLTCYMPDEVSEINCGDMTINIYPVPAEYKIRIEIKEHCTGFLVNIFDQIGNKVEEYNVPADNGQIDVNKLTPGVYILQVLYDDKIFHKKIIIAR
jgi:hypothetical protein